MKGREGKSDTKDMLVFIGKNLSGSGLGETAKPLLQYICGQ